MKRFYFLIFLLIFSFTSLKAQWVRCNVSLWDIEYISALTSALAINNNNIFVGSFANGIFRSLDDGNSWSKNCTGFEQSMVLTLAFKDSLLFAGTSSGMYLSSNMAQSWLQINKGLANDTVQSIAINGNDIFVGTISGGVFYSSDNGNNWFPKSKGLINLKIQSIAISNNNIFISTPGGIFFSSDNGNNWLLKNSDLIANTIVINKNKLFALCYFEGIFSSTDEGNSWIKCSGINNTELKSMAVKDDKIVVGTYSSDGVESIYISTNNGDTWSAKVFEENGFYLMEMYINNLIISDKRIFAITQVGVFKATLDDVVTSVDESSSLSNSQYINIIPSLAKEWVSLNLNKINYNFEPKKDINIYNSIGELVLSVAIQNRESQRINISALPRGLYFVRYGSEYAKFIKE